jgi:hypothetical protein
MAMRRRFSILLAFCSLVGIAAVRTARAQIVEFDEDFEDPDSVSANWQLNGSSIYVEVGQPECIDAAEANTPLPEDPCSLYPDEEGYVLLTYGVGNLVGNAFYNTAMTIDNIELEFEFEIREGSAPPADGFAFMMVGTPTVPTNLGEAGGAMGVSNLAPTSPTIVYEFDNWNNGGNDPSDNHVSFNYSAAGFPNFNAYQGTILATTDLGPDDRLHNGEAFPATPNRWIATMEIQSVPAAAGAPRLAVAALSLENADSGVDLGEVIRVEIPDYVPFEGFIGATSATGGAFENALVHGLSVRAPTRCILPVAEIAREVTNERDPRNNCGGNFRDGDQLPVTLTVVNARTGAGGICAAPASLRIVELLPEGFAPVAGSITAGGTYDAGTREISWNVASPLDGKVVGYTLDTGIILDVTSYPVVASVFNGAVASDGGVADTRNFAPGADPDTCKAEVFDDVFRDDPLSGGWTFNGTATWVPPYPESEYCLDPNVFDPALPCMVYDEAEISELEPEPVDHREDPEDPASPAIDTTDPENFGYVLVTQAVGNQSGAAWRSQDALYDNFRLDIVVELRDGSLGQPADGMTVVVLGSTTPPVLGVGGGAMGAAGLGNFPTMVFEFDNWNCNVGDSNDGNHVGFSWSKTGFPATDALPPTVFVPLDVNRVPLHNREAPPAAPNRYLMTVVVQGSTVACDLVAIDRGIDLGTVYTYEIPNFEPFRGFLGVTASTGGAWQNHILHSAKLTLLDDVCIRPAVATSRAFTGIDEDPDPAESCGGQFAEGDDIGVAITVDSVRAADPENPDDPCGTPARVRVTETPPAGWAVSGISDGGTLAGGTITWVLAGADVRVGKSVSYSVKAGAATKRRYAFDGRSIEVDAGGVVPTGARASVHGGTTALVSDYPFDDVCGGIVCWNLLGPYIQPFETTTQGNNPGEDIMRGDFLTDGDVTELDFPWAPGATVATDYSTVNNAGIDGAAYSVGLRAVANAAINPDDVPTVFPWNDPDSFINVNDDVYGGDPNGVMSYAQCYVTNVSDETVFIDGLGVSSDDAIQVLIDGVEVWINSVARGGADACSRQDQPVFDAPLEIAPDQTISVIVKTFEGDGGFNFAFRFQNAFGLSITEGLAVSKGTPVAPPTGKNFVRGDADGSGVINITDGIFVLSFLFTGGATPGCKSGADADDSGVINITDGIYVLSFLFTGGTAPPAPYPACGVDPGDPDGTGAPGCETEHAGCAI